MRISWMMLREGNVPYFIAMYFFLHLKYSRLVQLFEKCSVEMFYIKMSTFEGLEFHFQFLLIPH